jgi:nucleoside-diphosphate-sugar epimerase
MILVTGATGFYGINAVKHLVSCGEHVVATDLAEFPAASAQFFTEEERARIQYEACDVTDRETIGRVFEQHSIQRVIHAGAVTVLPSEDEEKARLVMDVNAVGTLNLLEASSIYGIKQFVYISSSGVYGSRGQGVAPLHETTPYDPMGLYVAAKIYSELMCRRFSEFGRFGVAVARIGSPYGPWERPTGTRHAMSFVYSMVSKAVAGEELRIFGIDSARDWTHMGDIARATIALAFAEPGSLKHLIYNVTTGLNVSTGRMAERLKQVIPGFCYQAVDEEAQANVVAHLPNPRGPLDVSRLINDCGFRFAYDIDAGLADYVDWFRAFKQVGA